MNDKSPFKQPGSVRDEIIVSLKQVEEDFGRDIAAKLSRDIGELYGSSQRDPFGAPPEFFADLRAEAEPEQKIVLNFMKSSEILGYHPPENLVLVGSNHIVRGTVFVLAGPPGVGKSRATIALAEAGAIGYEWFALARRCPFKTLIVQNENGLFRLKQEFLELNEPRLEDYLRITPPPSCGLAFRRKEFRDQLKAQMDTFGPELIILDPWNAIARDDRVKDYLETFDIVQSVIFSAKEAPALGIVAHTRKPVAGERANGRALLNLLAGSYVLGSIPRCVFVMQNASDDVEEERVVFTCCKNNDGELGPRSVWIRKSGLFEPCHNFDWQSWDTGQNEGLFTLEDITDIFEKNGEMLRQNVLAQKIRDFGVSRATAYRRISEAEKAGLIKFQKGTGVYVLS